MHTDPVIRVIAKILIPPILLFALYVQFHGDYGPGGGFQAGVIFASAFVLHAIVFGMQHKARIWPDSLTRLAIIGGALIFGGTGLAGMAHGKNFLDYNPLAAAPHDGQHYGILLIEFGVGLTVAAVMVALFFAFAGRNRHRQQIEKSKRR